ncbi:MULTISPECIES: glycosyltransferase family 2 protein [Enterobacteriaceae]|nr:MULTISPECIES: glycosyltransferase family 2 protein [Enterobacteriaceae]EEQ2705821.1 glycosyltransferase family 2 protein [Escherichia coli]EES3093016.1 glycosyltransferase family 2 protein [Escherichia coli]EFC4165468.1 glycosyltransferase family 2 protein [Escherichia coli]EFD86033.1 glycosyltransferase, group 2 family protein [Klebsiella variicola]EFH7593768.1 glycosyltransferase [Escherichia coli]
MSVSIIIPVYNVSSYLEEAINSVLKQISKNDEIIIVNDGSTDDSGEKIDRLYSNHPNVIIIHTTNYGLGGARNNGLKHATKEFVYYFDSDDILSPGLIKSFYSIINNYPEIDLFVFSAKSFSDSSGSDKLPEYDRGIDALFSDGKQAFSYLYSQDRCYPNAWLYITRRKVIDINNLTFKSIIHEDEEYTPRLFNVAGQTIVTKNIYFNRRIRNNSIMQSKFSERNIIGYIESVNSQMELVKTSNGIFNKMLKLRIINNISIMYELIYHKNIQVSNNTKIELAKLIDSNKGLALFFLERSFFMFRVYRYFELKFRKRIKIPYYKTNNL